ncbi:hypothetical protein LC612_24840 [Nostoc sp. CHAB 5834]|nr:hypothetical protein [Nostoc sp. CHAB 5834]
MNKVSALTISAIYSILFSFLATDKSAFAVAESEPNNSFADRQFLLSGSTSVNAQLIGENLDYFTFSNLKSGNLFTAQINTNAFDPLLALLDDFGSILAINDDSSDNSVLPILTGRIPTSNSLNFAVSGLRDINLIGNHFESGPYTLLLNSFNSPKPSVNETLINNSFESNDFAGWTTIGSTSIVDKISGSSATAGNLQALLSTGGATFTDSIIEEFIGLEAGSLDNLGNGNATSGSAIQQTFMAEAGDILTLDWNFLTNEVQFPPLNDFSFVTISSLSELADTSSARLNSSTIQFFQETGFQTFSFKIHSTGMYTLGIGVTDVGDNNIDSSLLVDNVRLISVPDKTSVLGILAFGILGAISVLKRLATL